MVRPTYDVTDEQVEQIEKLSAVLNIKQLSGYLGMCVDTFHQLKKRDERVFLAYQKGKNSTIASIGQSLVSKALSGHTVSQIFYLNTKGGWSEKKYDPEDEDETNVETEEQKQAKYKEIKLYEQWKEEQKKHI